MDVRQTFYFLFIVTLLISWTMACSPEQAEPSVVLPGVTFLPRPTLPLAESPPSTPDPLVISPEAVDWLQTHAVPFDTAEPGHGCADLQPLLKMIGDARLVALGEATHGTKEFAMTKHRILECLVDLKGFNVFAMEADWGESLQINDYVLGRTDSLPVLFENPGYWMWNTDEFKGLVEWMREHNENPGLSPVVSFYGLDMQSVTVTADYLLAYIESVDPEAINSVKRELYCFQNYILNPFYYQNASTETHERCRQGLQAIHDWILSHQETYEVASSISEFTNALHAARLILQNEKLYNSGLMFVNYRDEFMAENAVRLLEQAGPDAKMVLWAHNYHISTFIQVPSEEEMVVNELPPDYTYPLMGVYLRERYGDTYVNVGFDFGIGRFNAYPLTGDGDFRIRTFSVSSILPNSYEQLFSMVELPRYYIDLRLILETAAGGLWFDQPRWLRNISGYYETSRPENAFIFTVLPEIFDILIYFEETSPSTIR